jgi:hypothetical protein
MLQTMLSILHRSCRRRADRLPADDGPIEIAGASA